MCEKWCPENDRAWQMEQAEIHKDSLEAQNAILRARLAEVEKRLEYKIEADEQAHGLAQWWADKCKEVERQLSEANRECAEVESQRDGLKDAIENCIEHANGRESEWGNRAMDAFEILSEALAKLEGHDEK